MEAPPRPDERPILDVPSVPLGPPVPDAAAPKPVTGQAALSLAFLFGAFLLAVAVIVGLVAANIVLWNLGRVSFGLVILVVVALVGLGRAVLVSLRRPPDDPGEIEIPEAEEPELHATVRELAAEVGTRPPDRIVAIAAVNAYVHEYGRLLGLLPGRRTLAIGTPLFDALDVTQLRAVLGHELGHFAGGDTKTGPIVYRTAQVVSHLAASLRGGILSRLFTGLWSLQHRMTVGARRRQELIADRAAVRIAGRQSTVDALTRVEVTGRADAVYHTRLLVPLVGAGYRPDDLAAGLRHVLADQPTIARLTADAAADTVTRRSPRGAPADPRARRPGRRDRGRRTGRPGRAARRSAPAAARPLGGGGVCAGVRRCDQGDEPHHRAVVVLPGPGDGAVAAGPSSRRRPRPRRHRDGAGRRRDACRARRRPRARPVGCPRRAVAGGPSPTRRRRSRAPRPPPRSPVGRSAPGRR